MLAIKAKVRAIVVTGDLPVTPAVEDAARASGVTIVRSPHDTAISVDLARGAVRVGRMLEPEHLTFTPDTLLEQVREKAAHSAAFVFPILDDAGVLVGILAKSNLFKRAERQLILVDHNELSQAVKGADKVPDRRDSRSPSDRRSCDRFADTFLEQSGRLNEHDRRALLSAGRRAGAARDGRTAHGRLAFRHAQSHIHRLRPRPTDCVLEQLAKIAEVDPAQFRGGDFLGRLALT